MHLHKKFKTICKNFKCWWWVKIYEIGQFHFELRHKLTRHRKGSDKHPGQLQILLLWCIITSSQHEICQNKFNCRNLSSETLKIKNSLSEINSNKIRNRVESKIKFLPIFMCSWNAKFWLEMKHENGDINLAWMK